MKYFLDQEFQECFRKPLFGKDYHFIDLISIGMYAEDGRSYYAVSKDFNIKSVWNKYDVKKANSRENHSNNDIRVYWLRDNVLLPIWRELNDQPGKFSLKSFTKLIKRYGKTNEEIKEEIIEFVAPADFRFDGQAGWYSTDHYLSEIDKPEFYGYYADYDWVLFCSLFGRMIDLPKGFPMYCRDLKQMVDEKTEVIKERMLVNAPNNGYEFDKSLDGYQPTFTGALEWLKDRMPKQLNEHNAAADAKWNFDFFLFLKSI